MNGTANNETLFATNRRFLDKARLQRKKRKRNRDTNTIELECSFFTVDFCAVAWLNLYIGAFWDISMSIL